MTKILTKETIETIKEVVIDVALIEFNILDSNKYFKLASKIEDNQEAEITEIEVINILNFIKLGT